MLRFRILNKTKKEPQPDRNQLAAAINNRKFETLPNEGEKIKPLTREVNA